MRYIRLYGPFILLLIGLHGTALSQTNPMLQRFVLNVDYSRFWQNDSTMYVEIATAVYPNLVHLQQDSLGFHGKVELSISIQNKSTGEMVHVNRYNIPIHIPDSLSLVNAGSVVYNTVYALGTGEYHVTVRSGDIQDRSRKDSSSFTVNIQNRPDSIALSDVELCTNITESSDQKDIFYKNTYRVIPNPSCVFGATSFPLVYSYMEMYNLNTSLTYKIFAQIVDAKGTVKKQRSHLRRFSVPNVVDVTTLNCTSISSGRYIYEIVLTDTLGNVKARSRRSIFLHNPNIKAASAPAMVTARPEYDGMTSEELTEEFQKAKYIAQSDDNKTFEKLTSPQAQKEFLEKFWSRIESEESGKSNISRSVYLERVSISNQRYKSMARAGWKSDQGRIYIIYGEPDEIQRFPNSGNSKPYEVWYYHQIEGGVQFIYVDLTGFNEYTLVHSTKRGEIQDATWQQLLQ